MAILFGESLGQNNSRFVQMLGKVVELVLLSVGVISTLAVMKEAVLPYSCDLVFSSFVGFLSCIRCFLSSPRTIILLFINLMVVLIIASSAFQGRRDSHHHQENTTLLDLDHEWPPPPPPSPPPRDDVEVTPPPLPPRDVEITPPIDVVEVTPPPPIDVVEVTPPSPQRTRNNTNSIELQEEYMFIHNDEKSWENNEDNDDCTMEATWKAITGEGKQNPKKKPLKKSETWNAPPPPRRSFVMRRLDSEEVVPTSPKWKELRKAETFNDAVSAKRRGGMIRRDPGSMSSEEFNKKVEAFIKNMNDDMRLQRQESHNRFLDKINNGYMYVASSSNA